jgi:hypothetical protein
MLKIMKIKYYFMRRPRARKMKHMIQKKILKCNPYPNVYLDLKKRRFLMKKMIKRKLVFSTRPFREVENEDDYWLMIYDWNIKIGEMGDIDALDWLEMERFKSSLDFITPEEEDYYNSPRQSTYFAWQRALEKEPY